MIFNSSIRAKNQYGGMVMLSKSGVLARLEDDLRLRGRSKKTIHDYRFYVATFLDFANCSIGTMNEETVRDFLTYLLDERGLNPNSINAYRAAIIFFFTVTLDAQFNLLKVPHFKRYYPLPEILSADEFQTLSEHTTNPKHLCFFLLGYGSGLRAEEVASLRVCDIDSTGMRIFVQRGKGRKDRYTLLSHKCLDALRNYWKKAQPGYGTVWMFPGQSPDGHIDPETVSCAYHTWRNRLRLNPNTSFHSLRHGFATRLLENGVGLYQIKELMGHSALSSTMVYLHLSNVSKDIISPADMNSAYEV